MTVKMDGAWSRVPVSSHGPRCKDIAHGKNSLGGDDSFDHVGGVEVLLPMDGAIHQSQQKITHLHAKVVKRRRAVTMERNSDREWGDGNRISEE